MATTRHSQRTDEGQRSDSTSQAGDRVRQAGHDVKTEAEELGRQAQHQVTSQLDEQKDRASDQLGSMSSALRSTSENLREEDEDTIATYVDEAARQVDRVSDYLRTHSVSEMYDRAERFARREPALFLGGALVAGFLGSRFLKSSSPRRRHSRQRYRSGPPSGRHYSQVHGTPGGEMPETRRESSPSAERKTGAPAAQGQSAPTMPQAAKGRTSQQAAPSVPVESAEESDEKEVS